MNHSMIEMLADVLDTSEIPAPFWEVKEDDQPEVDDFAYAWDKWQEECLDTVNRMADQAMYAPEPPTRETGKIIAVEWEDVLHGGRWWVTMDEGHLDVEIWHKMRHGIALSDIDTPIAPAPGPRW